MISTTPSDGVVHSLIAFPTMQAAPTNEGFDEAIANPGLSAVIVQLGQGTYLEPLSCAGA